jgi:hypothetical protein
MGLESAWPGNAVRAERTIGRTLAALDLATTTRMTRLYAHLVALWGEPDDLIVYDRERSSRPRVFGTLHVAIWDARRGRDLTSFCTVGMSDESMIGARYRTELCLGRRGPVASRDRSRLATFLASITEYPFLYGVRLGWWERLANPGDIPTFPGCTQVLLAPDLGGGAFERFPAPDDDVKVLRVVPLAPRENQLLKERGPEAFADYCARTGADLFAPRGDAKDAGRVTPS